MSKIKIPVAFYNELNSRMRGLSSGKATLILTVRDSAVIRYNVSVVGRRGYGGYKGGFLRGDDLSLAAVEGLAQALQGVAHGRVWLTFHIEKGEIVNYEAGADESFLVGGVQ